MLLWNTAHGLQSFALISVAYLWQRLALDLCHCMTWKVAATTITFFFHWLCWVEVPRVTVPVAWEAVRDNEQCHPTGWKWRVQKSPERPEKIQAGERNGISAIFLISNLFCQMISLPLLRTTFTATFS